MAATMLALLGVCTRSAAAQWLGSTTQSQTSASQDSTAQGGQSGQGSQSSATTPGGPTAPTGAPPGLGEVGRMSQARNDSSAADSLKGQIAFPHSFPWIGPVHPTVTLSVGSGVSDVTLHGTSTLPLLVDGFRTNSTYTHEYKDYRQVDRTSQTEAVDTAWNRLFGKWGQLNVGFNRNSFHDSQVSSVGTFVVENRDSRGDAKLAGKAELPAGLLSTWNLGGDIQDSRGSTRGTNSDKTLTSSDAGASLAYDGGSWSASARAGGDRARGDRSLRGKTAPATTTTDTLRTGLSLSRGSRLSLQFDARRMLFEEKRLDFPRDNLGRVDTLRIDVGDRDSLAVQEEKEIRNGNALGATVRSQPLPCVQTTGSYRYESTETTYRINQQGLLQRRLEALDLGASYSHAEASSLSVRYSTSTSWTNQLNIGSSTFRGRETQDTKEASITLDQAIVSATSLKATVGERLVQNVFEDPTNSNDRDELYDFLTANLTSAAITNLRTNLSGTLHLTDYINIDQAIVPNNRQERFYELHGDYSWTGLPGVHLNQNYTLNIVYRDFTQSDDKDEFNKQGRFDTAIDVDLPRRASLHLGYTLDVHKNGVRDVETPGVYIPTERRFDHIVVTGVRIPVKDYSLGVQATRGFLDDEKPNVGTRQRENRGELHSGVTGKHKLRGNMDLDLAIEYVLAYGPRVREESRRYYVANTTVTMRF